MSPNISAIGPAVVELLHLESVVSIEPPVPRLSPPPGPTRTAPSPQKRVQTVISKRTVTFAVPLP